MFNQSEKSALTASELRPSPVPRQTAAMCRMCSKTRRIVADYLIRSGEAVFHLMVHDKIEPAKLTAGSRGRDDGALVYPLPLTSK